jgi:hypothetical protein
MGRWFDGPSMLGWSDPNPGRWYVCRTTGCPVASEAHPLWSEGAPQCPKHHRRMVLAARQPGVTG